MSTTVRSTAASLRVLLARSVDYAGLFAPASLDMSAAVGDYASYLHHPQRWALGRFVLPVSRLDEFLSARAGLRTASQADAREGGVSEPWQLSAILSANFASDLAQVKDFNRKASGAAIDSIEARISKTEQMELIREHRPAGTTAFFEIAPERADELLPWIGRNGGCAKLRTGGVEAGAFPAMKTIAGFLARCAELGVPFKATAGLHHALRCLAPLTYEANSARTMMCGFLNLFTAAAIAWSARQSGSPVLRAALAACLADPERAHWHFADDALTWSGEPPFRIERDTLGLARSNFALSFGSCSFQEPIDELHALELL
jgi:hypothetical protein